MSVDLGRWLHTLNLKTVVLISLVNGTIKSLLDKQNFYWVWKFWGCLEISGWEPSEALGQEGWRNWCRDFCPFVSHAKDSYPFYDTNGSFILFFSRVRCLLYKIFALRNKLLYQRKQQVALYIMNYNIYVNLWSCKVTVAWCDNSFYFGYYIRAY